MNDTDSMISNIVEMFRDQAIAELKETGEVAVFPKFGIVITCDPRTGAPVMKRDGTGPGLGLVVMIPVSMADESEKDRVCFTAALIAASGQAVACVTLMDSWCVEGEDAKRAMRIGARNHPNRVECLTINVERRGHKCSSIERTIYRRDQGQILFDPTEKMEAEISGRFVVLAKHELPQHAVLAARSILAAGAPSTLSWESL